MRASTQTAPPRWVGSKLKVPQPFPSSLLPGLNLGLLAATVLNTLGPIRRLSSQFVCTLVVRLPCNSKNEVGYGMGRDEGGLLALQPTLPTLRFATTHSRLLAGVP